MDNYYFNKYLKYKKRYLELRGGKKEISFDNYLKTNINAFEYNLFYFLSDDSFDEIFNYHFLHIDKEIKEKIKNKINSIKEELKKKIETVIKTKIYSDSEKLFNKFMETTSGSDIDMAKIFIDILEKKIKETEETKKTEETKETKETKETEETKETKETKETEEKIIKRAIDTYIIYMEKLVNKYNDDIKEILVCIIKLYLKRNNYKIQKCKGIIKPKINSTYNSIFKTRNFDAYNPKYNFRRNSLKDNKIMFDILFEEEDKIKYRHNMFHTLIDIGDFSF